MAWRCVVCYVFVALTLKSLLSHINVTHSRSPDFRVVCGIDGCAKEYRVYNSFWYHIKRCHAEHLLISASAASRGASQAGRAPEVERRDCASIHGNGGRTHGAAAPNNTINTEHGAPEAVDDENHAVQPLAENAMEVQHFGSFDTTRSVYSGLISDTTSRSPPHTHGGTSVSNSTPRPCDGSLDLSAADSTLGPCDGSLDLPAADDSFHCQNESHYAPLTRQATAIVMAAREKHHLSQNGVNEILAAMQQYQTLLVTSLRSQVKTTLQQHESAEHEMKVMEVFDQFEDPLAAVSTTYLQDSMIRKCFGYVEPEEVCVGYAATLQTRGAKRVFASVPKCFHYVPLIRSLEQFLSHPKILAMVNEPQTYSSDGYLYDIRDGELMRSHPLFSLQPSALQIILYYDGIEIANPLGSYASKNKLLMFYYTLANINPKFRSRLPAIRLLGIALQSQLSDCGIDAILNRLQKDLLLLYNGVKMQIGNKEQEVFGALISICGDTLAQHELCGFKEGVGFAYSKCRQCECVFEEMQMYFDEDYFEQRSLERHVRQCDNIEKASTEYLKNQLKTTYGINRKSKVIDFPGFNFIHQTPQDIMHIILEGVAPLEIKCVLKHLILTGQLDLDHVNSIIVGFPYSPLDVRDKPSLIAHSTLASSDNKLKQSSGQMIVLLKILPFIMDKVKGSDYHNIILELMEIIHILFAPVICLQTVDKLKQLIEKHLNNYKRLFPENNITPKQHYLIHAPSQIKLLGPMVRHMCMRFESKHCFFKQWASKGNFKNVCKSLVKHNQLYESSQNANINEHPIFSNECNLGPVSEVKNLVYLKEKARAFLGRHNIKHAVSVKWIVLNGNKYISNKTLIATTVSVNSLPEFGLVRKIYVINSSLYCFEFQQYNTLSYERDYMAYKIEVPMLAQANDLLHADSLVDFTPYYIVTHNSTTYVPVKYYLGDVIERHKSL